MMRHSLRPVLLGLALPLLYLLAVGGAMCAPHAGATRPNPAAVNPQFKVLCFPASHWGPAPGSQRPCAVVTRPAEDGSVVILQQTASRDLGYCVLPNPREERGAYVAHCHRSRGAK